METKKTWNNLVWIIIVWIIIISNFPALIPFIIFWTIFYFVSLKKEYKEKNPELYQKFNNTLKQKFEELKKSQYEEPKKIPKITKQEPVKPIIKPKTNTDSYTNYNGWKSIWDGYETVVDKLNKK